MPMALSRTPWSPQYYTYQNSPSPATPASAVPPSEAAVAHPCPHPSAPTSPSVCPSHACSACHGRSQRHRKGSRTGRSTNSVASMRRSGPGRGRTAREVFRCGQTEGIEARRSSPRHMRGRGLDCLRARRDSRCLQRTRPTCLLRTRPRTPTASCPCQMVPFPTSVATADTKCEPL